MNNPDTINALSPLEALLRTGEPAGEPISLSAGNTTWIVPPVPFRAIMRSFSDRKKAREICLAEAGRYLKALPSDSKKRTAFIIDHPGFFPELLLPARIFTTRLVAITRMSSINVVPALIKPEKKSCKRDATAQELVWLSSNEETAENTVRILKRTGWKNPPVILKTDADMQTSGPAYKFTAFHASDDLAPEWLAACLWEGRIPVVMGNAVVLPFPNEVDYKKAVITMGDSPAELGQLRFLAETGGMDATQELRVDIARQYYAPERVRAEMLRILTDSGIQASNIFNSIKRNPFPAFTDDGELVREEDLFRALWRKLGQRFPARQARPVLFFGAGRFLTRLFEAVKEMPDGPAILGVADDRAETNVFCGFPLAAPESYPSEAFSAVLTATDAIEDKLAARCRSVYGEDVEIIKPSEWMTLDSDTLEITRAAECDCRDDRADSGFRPACPEKIEAVMVCVGYGDILSRTLPLNRAEFDNITVVTTPEDGDTRRVVHENGARVALSSRHRDSGAPFNKGRMLNDGLASLDLDGWIMFTDADILFQPGMRRRLRCRRLHQDALYYATRLDAPEQNTDAWLEEYILQPEAIYGLPFYRPGRNRMPWGYFQLAHVNASVFRGKGRALYPEIFPTACDVDYAFQNGWPDYLKILLPELVVHIPHGREGINWSGRRSPPFGEGKRKKS